MDPSNTVSVETARALYADAKDAYTRSDHPCHRFRALQPGVPDEEWQLPEPFNGRSAQAGMVFLGLNPSYDPGEAVPRIRASFDEWNEYYRCRFDGPSKGWHKLYRRYQQIGELAFSPAFRLGIDAMALEIIRFRSAAGAACSDPAVLQHELPITGRLLAEIAPRVVVTNGSAALWGIQSLWPRLQEQIALGTPILKVEHQRFHLETSWGDVSIVPSRHLSASFGLKLSMLDRVAEAIVGTQVRA